MVVATKYGTYDDVFAKYVRPTKMCDFDVAEVKKQANSIKDEANTVLQAVTAAHAFVASLPIGFDPESWPASKVLKAGRGQCITKTTLFVTLLRAMGIPARIHGYRVHKVVHKKRMPFLVYAFTPKTTLFTYPEIYYKGEWTLLSELVKSSAKPDWESCPFDDAAARAAPLKEEWIAEDLGSFWHPDLFVEKYGTNADGWRKPFFPLAKAMLN